VKTRFQSLPFKCNLQRYIEEVEKVQFINTIKNVPTEEGRSAELCLFRRRPEEAEAILLQAGLIFRAIETNVRLFNWDRALELAVQHKTHVDTVIYYRNIYLAQAGRAETNQRFMQYAQSVQVDEVGLCRLNQVDP
jgi:intraflagellar transport protein 80